MNRTNSLPDIKGLLLSLGYHETSIPRILNELDELFNGIDFNKIRQIIEEAAEAKDTKAMTNSLKNLMFILENKGYYRPDAPTPLIKHLINGLNLKNEDIFALLEKANIPEGVKKNEQELLASCAAITQLGYILLSCLLSEVKAATSGSHVFLVVDSFSPHSKVFVDFSIDSIIEIEVGRYDQKEQYYYLKNTQSEPYPDILTKYYSFFHVTSGAGLSHNIHNNLGITYDRIGRYEEAIEELEAALRLDPGYVEAHNNLAVIFGNVGTYEGARKELKEALRLNPFYVEAHSNLGNIYVTFGRYKEAAEELKEALRLNPGFAIAHNNLGNVYALQNRNMEAIGEFKEALRLNPDYAPAHNNLGNMYSELGRFEEALQEYQEALRLDSEFPEALYGIGFVHYNLGSYERAAQALTRAVYLNPELLECVPEKLSLKVRQGVSRLKGRD